MAVSSSTRKTVQHGGGLLKLFKFEKTIAKATRWIKGVIGTKEEKQEIDNKSDHSEKTMRKSQHHFPSRAHFKSSVSGPEIDQIKQAIKVATTTLATAEAAAEVAEAAIVTAARLSSSINGQPESEQSKHAIDVATASVAAVESIVAAAEVTVVVARLTSYGKSGLSSDDDEREKLSAAVMIQRVFRGYLARKALRALKGLVKLQALVRGNLVRNRVAAALHSMRGFAQSQQREICSIHNDRILEQGMRSRESFVRENFDKTSSASQDPSFKLFEESPKTMGIDTCGFKFGANTPVKPAKSSCGGCFFKPYYNKHPNYMANTHSFRAKLSSSHSIMKQKLEPPLRKKNLSNNKIMAVRS